MRSLRDLLHSRPGGVATGSSWRRLALGAALVHLALLGLYYWPEQKPGLGDEGMYLEAAQSVIRHGRSDLGSFWPPFYAWFIAPLLWVAGGSPWLVQGVQTALLVLSAWLLRELIEHALKDRWAANLGALLVVSYPPLVAYAHYLWPEILHLALMLGALLLLVRSGARNAAVLAGGLLIALCLQTKALLLPLLPLLALALWRVWPPGRRLAALMLLSATVALGVLPTLLAQQRDFGHLALADSGRFNLWVGLNEVSRDDFVESLVVEEYSRYQQSARSPAARSRIAQEKIATLLAERGWWATLERQLGRQYHRLLGHESFLTEQLIGGAVWERGGGYRAGDSTAARALRAWSFILWASILAAAAWGIALFGYRQRPVGRWVLAFLLIQCALFLVLHVKTRYRIQMLPGLLFFAVYAAGWWRQRRASSDREPLPGLRAAAGLLLAGGLLYLAFSG